MWVQNAAGLWTPEETPPTRLAVRRRVRVEDIWDAVEQTTGVYLNQIIGRGRQRAVVVARALFVHLCREHTIMSYPEIAQEIGRSNHSTVITAHRRFGKQMRSAERLNVIGGETANALVYQANRVIWGRVQPAKPPRGSA